MSEGNYVNTGCSFTAAGPGDVRHRFGSTRAIRGAGTSRRTPGRFEHRRQDRASATADGSRPCSIHPLGIASQWGWRSSASQPRRNPPWAKVRSCASTKTDVLPCWVRPAGGVFSFQFLREESFEILPCLYAKDRFVATANAWLSVFQRYSRLISIDIYAKHKTRSILVSLR